MLNGLITANQRAKVGTARGMTGNQTANQLLGCAEGRLVR